MTVSLESWRATEGRDWKKWGSQNGRGAREKRFPFALINGLREKRGELYYWEKQITVFLFKYVVVKI